MGQNYDAVVFDVDGTLLDTSEGVLSAVRYTIKQFDFPEISESDIQKFIGPPIQDSFARQYGLEGEILQDIATVFRNRYKDVDLLKAKAYEGIYEVLEALLNAGIQPTIATYKRQDYARAICEHFGFHKYTDFIYGADHENKLKKKDIIEKSLIDAGVTDFSKAIMVGDSDNDAIGADAIGTKFVGVTYGFGFHSAEDAMKYPNIGVAKDTQELRDILLNATL